MIKKIMNSYIKSKKQTIPKIYKPSNIWTDIIKQKTKTYQPFIEKKDINGFKELLTNFLQNEKLYGNTFSIPTPYIMMEYLKWKKLEEANIEEIEDPGIGNPQQIIVGDMVMAPSQKKLGINLITRITTSSLRFQYFAAKITKLLKNIENPVIIEIGAGYGGQAYYLIKKIKRKITYIIFDLPELNILSSYYLSEAYPDKKILLYDDWEDRYHRIEYYDIIILPNFELPNIPSMFADIFLNFRSFSEMNMESIKDYINQITRILKQNRYFMHENSRGRYKNGEKYCIGYQEKIPETSALEFPIPKNLDLIYEKRSIFYAKRYYEFLYQLKQPPKCIELNYIEVPKI